MLQTLTYKEIVSDVEIANPGFIIIFTEKLCYPGWQMWQTESIFTIVFLIYALFQIDVASCNIFCIVQTNYTVY